MPAPRVVRSCLAASLASLAAVLVPAAVARADDAPVVVAAPGARAVIQQHPFRLRVETADGRTALQEVGERPGPQVEPPTLDPIAPGTDNPRTTTHYAPLSFTVGTESLAQYTDGEWEGNLQSGTRSGTQYTAGDVLSVTRDGQAAHLVVATDDPAGRRLLVDVAPEGDAAIRVAARPDDPRGVSQVGDAFASGTDEGFFGFGGRHTGLDQRGAVLSSFVQEENLLLGGTVFPNGPTAAYYPQGLFYSSRPYGFLLDQPELTRFKLDADRPDAWAVTASAPSLSYVVAPGDPRTAIGTITSLSGRQPVPPDWGVGPMLDRLVRNNDETVANYEAELKQDLVDIDRYDLPLTAYRIEGSGLPGGNRGLSLHTWVTPDAQATMIRELHARGIHPLSYLRPWLEPDSDPVRRGFAVTHADGSPYYVTVSGDRRVALVDFTNPQAVAWWQDVVAATLDLGFDGLMQDYGEHVLLDMRFHDGSTGVTMHNAYLATYARATREELDRYGREHPERGGSFVFTRGGYSGRPGSTAYENANFPGDETTDFSHETGLRSLTSDMLNRAVGGAYGFGTDIGGYLDYTTPPTTKELFLRWAEWAAFSPVFRLHGSGRTGTHTPWSFDEETVRVYKRLSELHERAAPLILRLWREAARTGVPPTRPLWLVDPGDPAARTQDQEWLLGDDLLVAPVVEEGATSRSVHFPQGCWQRLDGDARYDGRSDATVPAALDELPAFVRCGTDPLAAPDAAGSGSATTTPTAPAPVPAGAATPAAPVAVPCRSRRSLLVHLPRGRRSDRVRSARATLDGRRLRVTRRAGRLVVRVDLRGRALGRHTLRVAARTASGRRVALVRRYRTCAVGR